MITYIQFQLELGTSHAHGPLLHTGDYLRDHVIIRLAAIYIIIIITIILLYRNIGCIRIYQIAYIIYHISNVSYLRYVLIKIQL